MKPDNMKDLLYGPARLFACLSACLSVCLSVCRTQTRYTFNLNNLTLQTFTGTDVLGRDTRAGPLTYKLP